MSVEGRIRQLERELLQLRRDLGRESEALPAQAFDVLELRAGEAWYAVPIAAVREVLQMLWCEPVAEAPPWLMGTFSTGADVVPVVDLRQRLDGTRSECDPRMTLVVVDSPAPVGLAAQEIGELRRVDPQAVVPPRQGIPQAPFLLGSIADGGRQLRLLSPRRIGSELVLEPEDGGPRVG